MREKRYFAAANGFSGFRCYFKSIFNPSDYTRIYILKGGPGTGKSTLMKKIKTFFADYELDCDLIFCSSDPKSLDGIIIQNKKNKIALIDGTAPHECDAKYPGAVDEIINLGAAFDKNKLTSSRDRIIELNEIKSQHYSSAYEHLKLAGMSSMLRNKIYKKAFISSGEKLANAIFKNISTLKRGRVAKNKLLSSFGKNGYYCLESSFSENTNEAVAAKEHEKSVVLLQEIYTYISSCGIEADIHISPLSDDIIEQIFLPDSEQKIIYNDTLIYEISNTFDNTILDKYNEIIDKYTQKIKSELLDAQIEFSKASTAHFALESLYTPAMNFTHIDYITNNIIEEIKSILL